MEGGLRDDWRPRVKRNASRFSWGEHEVERDGELFSLEGRVEARISLIENFFNFCTEMPFASKIISLASVKESF